MNNNHIYFRELVAELNEVLTRHLAELELEDVTCDECGFDIEPELYLVKLGKRTEIAVNNKGKLVIQ